VRSREADRTITRELQSLKGNDFMQVPPDLESRVRQCLVQYPPARWDPAVQLPVLKRAARGRFDTFPAEGRS
jgi:hypothetical protein